MKWNKPVLSKARMRSAAMTFALLTAASACSLSGEVDNDGANIDGEVSVPNSVSVPLNGTQGE